MRIFKTKTLAKFTRQNGISDEALVEAVERAKQGLIDADLGGKVIKQRVARPGKGKRGTPSEPGWVNFCQREVAKV